MKGLLNKILSTLLILGWIPCLQPVALPQGNGTGPAFRETVWLETGRHLYLPGETVCYSATLLEKDTYKPSLLSRYIRVELMDSLGNPLIRQNSGLDSSRTLGTISLASDLKTGWYYIRSYTNWMRNFPESDYTVVPIRVVNPADPGLAGKTGGKMASENKPVRPEPEISVQDDHLHVTLKNLDPGITGTARLMVHRSYTRYWLGANTISGNSVDFDIPANTLPEGIVQFSVLAGDNSVLASRLWSGYEAARHRVAVSVKNDNPGIRGIYIAECRIPGQMTPGGVISWNARVSVQEPGALGDILPGLPGWSFCGDIPADPGKFGTWLENNCYPDECVRAFFEPEPRIQYLPETRPGILGGRVLDKRTQKGVPALGVGITILNDNRFDAIKTNSDGLFYFALPEKGSSMDYILSFITEPDSVWAIEVFPEFDNRPFRPAKLPFSLSREELQYVQELNINQQLTRIYGSTEIPVPVHSDTVVRQKPFYYPPERTIETDRYIELANVREVVYEVVPDVQVHQSGKKVHLGVYSSKSYSRDYETLIMIDGIPLTDHRELLELPPGRIKTIEVKNRIYIHGNYIFSAVVNFISRNSDYAGLRLPEQSVLGTFHPVAESDKAVMKNSKSPASSTPVLDPTLLWVTGKSVWNQSIPFGGNDGTGNFQIQVYGFDSDGLWFSGYQNFLVKGITR